MPDWLPIDYQGLYNNSDLEYDPFCIELFAKLEAVKRDNFPKETMRIWFMEFLRRGWTKKIILKRYEALLSTKIYGIEKLDFADWVNSVPVFAEDEVNLMIKQRIDSIIQRGNYLKNKKIKLSEDDKKAIELAEAKKIKFELNNKRYELMEEEAREIRQKYFESLSEKKKKILNLSLEEKMKIVDELYDSGKVKGEKSGFEYQVVLHNLEDYSDLINI